MAQELRTFEDIYTAIMESVRVQSGDTTSLNRIKRWVNMAYTEVLGFHEWRWLQDYTDLSVEAAYATGTASVTQNSHTVTLSTGPGISKEGYFFSVQGHNEIYKIAKHSGAASTAVVLTAPYTGSTDSEATFKIWKDSINLPADCLEIVRVTQDFKSEPLEGFGLRRFREYVQAAPKAEGRPQIYSLGEAIDPKPYEDISGLPASSTRSSDGLVKTIVFASTVADYLAVGDRIKVSGCSGNTYNGEVIVRSVSTTTVTYTGPAATYEASTSDTGVTVQLLSQQTSNEDYKELFIYPSLNNSRTTLHIDYTRDGRPLEDDDDEPLIPLNDRTVLFHGGCMYAFEHLRNDTTKSTRHEGQFYSKLARMAGKTTDSTDSPILTPSKGYLANKRRGLRVRALRGDLVGFSGSSSSSNSDTIQGTANTVAVFNASGELGSSSTITTTELETINGATSNIQTQIDDLNTLASGKIYLGNGSNVATEVTPSGDVTIDNAGVTAIAAGVIVNADISASADIARSKILEGTANHVVINDSNGDLSSEAALAISRGGTGQATATAAFDALAPTTTQGDVIYHNGTDNVRLGAGTNGQVLITQGAGANPTFATAPGNATVLKIPSIQKFLSGSGTYTTPSSPTPLYIRVVMVGGGGAGAGGGQNDAGDGGTGGNTTFGSSLLSANGGVGGEAGDNNGTTGGGAGGTASLGTGPIGVALSGGSGCSGFAHIAGQIGKGGAGASSPFGGAGGTSSGGGNSDAAIANTGSGGGGGGGQASQYSGGGGGAGGYVDAIITAPSATYAYAVGAAGTAGTAGTGGGTGGAGGSGVIVVYEHYQ